jgi:hypothetical protein
MMHIVWHGDGIFGPNLLLPRSQGENEGYRSIVLYVDYRKSSCVESREGKQASE